LRWIEVDGQDQNSLNFLGLAALTHDPKLLRDMYASHNRAPGAPDAVAKNADAYNLAVREAVYKAAGVGTFSLPTLWWWDEDDVLHVTNRTYLEQAVVRTKPRPIAAFAQAASNNLMNLQRQFPLRPQYVVVAGPEAHVYVAPTTKGPIIHSLATGYRTALKSTVIVAGETWFELGSQPPVARERNSLFVRAAEVSLMDR